MVIECSSCQARFKLADDKIKSNGTKVRCTKCREVFTVFPETTPALSNLTPSVETENKTLSENIEENINYSHIAEKCSFAETSLPVDEEDNWAQGASSAQFIEDSSANIGFTDLDAISFDNIETPVFSVTTENDKVVFDDDREFSFAENNDLGIDSFNKEENGVRNEFDPDFSLASAPPIPSAEDQLTIDQTISTEEFTFSPTENLADFSWDDADSTPVETVSKDKLNAVQAPPQDTDFDFSSFSFDDVAAPVITEKPEGPDELATNEGNFEIASDSLSLPSVNAVLQSPPLEQRVISNARQDNPRVSVRQLRSHSRTKKKGTSRFFIKAVSLILLLFAVIFGFLNREQIYAEYKNLVSRFIEKQVSIVTSGRISLVNLTGSYLVNNQSENMFIIRGDAVNEFKELRSSVLVRGTIFDEKGAVLQSQTAYCGNPLKDSNLKKLGYKEIRYTMNNELGENLVNLNIQPGKGIPFLIVFNGAPKSIKEFSVEVLESKPGSK